MSRNGVGAGRAPLGCVTHTALEYTASRIGVGGGRAPSECVPHIALQYTVSRNCVGDGRRLPECVNHSPTKHSDQECCWWLKDRSRVCVYFIVLQCIVRGMLLVVDGDFQGACLLKA